MTEKQCPAEAGTRGFVRFSDRALSVQQFADGPEEFAQRVGFVEADLAIAREPVDRHLEIVVAGAQDAEAGLDSVQPLGEFFPFPDEIGDQLAIDGVRRDR